MRSVRNKALIQLISGPNIRLKDYCAIQDFYCVNDVTRTLVLDLVDILVDEFFKSNPPWNRYANFLIWGDTGVGKTHLVKQLHKEVVSRTRRTVGFDSLKLTEMSDTKLQTAITRIKKRLGRRRRILAFVDEIDAWGGSFEKLRDAVEWNKEGGRAIVWIFAGSHGRNIGEMISLIRRGKKGKDLIERIPGHFRYTIPRLRPEDKVIIAGAIARRRGIKRIDKAALLGIALHDEFGSSRAISELIEGACIKIAHKKKLTYSSIWASDGDAHDFLQKMGGIRRYLDKTIDIVG